MIIARNGKDAKTVESHFLVVIYKNVYNCTLGRPFVAAIDTIASLFHVKLKFHNLHGESITINVDLVEAKRINQALQQDQKEWECITMEINVPPSLVN